MPPSSRRRALATLACLPGIAAAGLRAPAARAQAEEPVILRITGRLVPERPDESFTLARLEALGRQDLETRTPWSPAPLRFSGVPLLRLLEAVGARGTMLRAIALDEHEVRIPSEDARRNGAFLATRQGGRPLRIRDRGPLWILYPWSARADLDTVCYRNRSIWQLRQIEVI